MAAKKVKETIEMVLERETKNTFRFSAPDAVIETLYVRKDAFGDQKPDSITITLEA